MKPVIERAARGAKNAAACATNGAQSWIAEGASKVSTPAIKVPTATVIEFAAVGRARPRATATLAA